MAQPLFSVVVSWQSRILRKSRSILTSARCNPIEVQKAVLRDSLHLREKKAHLIAILPDVPEEADLPAGSIDLRSPDEHRDLISVGRCQGPLPRPNTTLTTSYVGFGSVSRCSRSIATCLQQSDAFRAHLGAKGASEKLHCHDHNMFNCFNTYQSSRR